MASDKVTYSEAPSDMRKFAKRDFLASWDLEGQDRTVQIKRVVTAHIPARQGRPAEVAGGIFFCGASGKEHPKPFRLNSTNTKTITALYGASGPGGKNWAGKLITLYPTTTQVGGETVQCIRVRPTAPKTKPIGDVREDVSPDEAEIAKQDAAFSRSREPGDD